MNDHSNPTRPVGRATPPSGLRRAALPATLSLLAMPAIAHASDDAPIVVVGEAAITTSSQTGPYDEFARALAFTDAELLVGHPGWGVFGSSGRLSRWPIGGGASGVEDATIAPGDDVDRFNFAGIAVDANSDVVALGSFDSGHVGTYNGPVWIFERAGDGWVETARVDPDPKAFDDRFGDRVAVGDGVVAIGARFDDALAEDAGRVFVVRRVGDGWSVVASIGSPAPSANGEFGAAIAISGDVLAVGEPGAAGGRGAAHLFRLDETGATHRRSIEDGSAGASARFGAALDLDGGVLVVGSPGDGRATRYAVAPSLDQAILRETYTVDGVGSDDAFGAAIAVGEGRLLVGAPRFDDRDEDDGAAFAWAFEAGRWRAAGAIRPALGPGAAAGTAVRVAGDVLAVGAPLAQVDGQPCGAVVTSRLSRVSPAVPGDADGDGFVTGADVFVVLGDWLRSGAAAGDVSGDGFVNGVDLVTVLSRFGD